MDWQYGVTHWLALRDEPRLADEPPEGDGWILNDDIGDNGHVVKVPAWSDGSIVCHRTLWRRHKLGHRHWLRGAYVDVNRRPWFNGSDIPERILRESERRAAEGVSRPSGSP
ncbi:hypothetical protein [Kribbella solani]|uniref:Uncharacterized protein n=1 Tax=Kribbella solani TaxID=236067 RepID=A0A841DXV4_9ACTN|nr:hypothetical protein [Kribbella solani]MBB5982801.1 hypothetical protein [Kribbella solani]